MKALIVVDVQRDFVDGSLAVPGANEIFTVINKLLPEFDLIIFTQDWHDPEMEAFASQHTGTKPFDKYTNLQGDEDTLWPDHCIANTPGADFHPNLDFSKIKKDFYIFKKGLEPKYHPYSGFSKTGLAEFLREKGVDDVIVCGLALDFCVADTAVDAAMEGFKVIVIEDATASVNTDINTTLIRFYDAHIALIESWELSMMGLM